MSKSWWRLFRRWLRRENPEISQAPPVVPASETPARLPLQARQLIAAQLDRPLDADAIRRLMEQVEKTRAEEYSCEQTFALLDEYVELVNSDEEKAALMPLVQHHVDMCPHCRERFEILLNILRSE